MLSRKIITWGALKTNYPRILDGFKAMCGACQNQLRQLSSFKSNMTLENIYPNSDMDYLKRKQHETDDPDTFSGYIPVEQLEISHSRSSGPGGQNVNKVNSKVEVRFHLDTASWIPQWIKPRLSEQEQNRITKDGYFVIRSDMTRKQMLNQADCLNKLRTMIYQASVLQEGPTEEQLKKKEERMSKAKAGVLREKRRRSLVKKSRSHPDL